MKEVTAHPIYLLAGPTASGKSQKALMWTQKTGGIILNADSMQLYEAVPTFTARPSAEDEARAPHVLYGGLKGDETASAGQWVGWAKPYLEAALNGGTPVCVVGGTGLYFNALIHGLAAIPEVSEQTRQNVTDRFEEDGEALFREKLRAVDPLAEARIAPNDRQRLIRAFSVWQETERSLSDWQADTTPLLPASAYAFERLLPDRAWLYERCDRRFLAMWNNGALDEVSALMQSGLRDDWPIMRVLGLKEAVAFLRGEMDKDTAISSAQQMTRNYAKRQFTWFKNQFS